MEAYYPSKNGVSTMSHLILSGLPTSRCHMPKSAEFHGQIGHFAICIEKTAKHEKKNWEFLVCRLKEFSLVRVHRPALKKGLQTQFKKGHKKQEENPAKKSKLGLEGGKFELILNLTTGKKSIWFWVSEDECVSVLHKVKPCRGLTAIEEEEPALWLGNSILCYRRNLLIPVESAGSPVAL